jgi:DNA-binding response OmpR family regulator
VWYAWCGLCAAACQAQRQTKRSNEKSLMSHIILPGETPVAQRILVVDDDPAIQRLVKDKLETAGYEVFTAASGHQALEIIGRRGMPHLAVVDINMPGMNGLEFCEAVQQFSDLPVIMLSAVDEEEIIIQSISRYAEDYVTKPFSPRELVARIERVLRRIGDFAYTLDLLTRVDDHLAVDFPHQRALVDERPIPLTPTETKLLYLLIRNAGKTVTAGFLLRRLWPMEEVFEDTLRVHVHRLRQKIEPTPSHPRYILTERGLGYSFPARL